MLHLITITIFVTTYQYSKNVVIYISSFVAKKLLLKVQCEDCSSAIVGTKENLENIFLEFKNHRSLTYPSDDLIQIYVESEIVLYIFIQ